MSLPHFLLADDDLRMYAQGMRPEREVHSSQLYIEPVSIYPTQSYTAV